MSDVETMETIPPDPVTSPVPVAPSPPPPPSPPSAAAVALPVPVPHPVASSPSAPPASSQPAGKTFTQAELDKLVGEARATGRRSAYSYIQKELGVPVVNEAGDVTLDQLRGLVHQARTGETASSAQLRDLLTQQQAAEQRIAEKESEYRGAIGRAQDILRRGEARVTAVQLGFHDPSDAVAMLGNLSRFEVDLETQTVAGLHDALQALATEKPYLLKGATATASPPAPTPPPALPATPKPTDSRANAEVDDEERLLQVRRQASSFF